MSLRHARAWPDMFLLVVLQAATASAATVAGLVPRWSGLTRPVYVTGAGDGSGRVFIVEQGGVILRARPGAAAPSAFLDISAEVACCGERGLLSVAFPPDFAARQVFFVYYTALSGNNRIARFAVSADPDVADPASEALVLEIPHPTYANHNGGQLAFGPDGYLYAGTGDGGGAGDPSGNAQNLGVLLGKLLRLDVGDGVAGAAIPPGNPFVSTPGALDEIWAFGLRNPWRFAFDRVTGDLWIGDVGQGAWEEVDLQPASSSGGENYGWNVLEGTHCYPPGSSCDSAGTTLPVYEYPHTDGCAVTGGVVYRGSAFAGLVGRYLFSDSCSGSVWALEGGSPPFTRELLTESGASVVSFGQDDAGAVYVATLEGTVYELVGAGDANGDGRLSVADAFVLIDAIYGNGAAPLGPGDANSDGVVSPADVIYLVSILF